MKYLMDLSFCAALLKAKDETLIHKLKEYNPHDFALSSVVKSELIYAARMSEHVDDNLTLLQKFFSQFESYSFDEKAAGFFGLSKAITQAAGNTGSFMGSLFGKSTSQLNNLELMQAGIAMSHDMILLTRMNKEYAKIPGIRVEIW
ncbi:MAG: type II toxin-antitoxin system VapC family toxin [bacterium]|nr:type II toxin-antitoxin system VapC family toxin [bacterium]MBU1916720.1 type II toxin-antitoxin system VapC family toxin [bacterium]